jgi:hypothetical protein
MSRPRIYWLTPELRPEDLVGELTAFGFQWLHGDFAPTIQTAL